MKNIGWILCFALLWNLVQAQSSPNVSQEQNFFHNLTDIINKVLFDGDINNTKILQKSLEWSPLVLYSTDLSLNNLAGIIVNVSSLLNQFSPRHQLMISLQFVEGSRFKWSRVKDLYYDFTPSVSEPDRSLIIAHLAAILLDWQTEISSHCYSHDAESYRRGFYSKYFGETSHAYVDTTPYSFPVYVKNYLELVMENNHTPVGILYTPSQMSCHTFLRNQAEDSDFCVIGLNFMKSELLNLLPEKFHQSIKSVLKQQQAFVRNKTTSFLVTFNEKCPFEKTYTWDYSRWEKMIHVMTSLPYIQNITQTFQHQLYGKHYLKFLANLVRSLPQNNGTNVIFGKKPEYVANFTEAAKETRNIQKTCIYPCLNTTEQKTDICALSKVLNQFKTDHANVVLNLDTWRTLAKNKNKLKDAASLCAFNYQTTGVWDNPINAILYMNLDSWKVWKEIEVSVIELTQKFKTINGMTVETVLFHRESIQLNNFTIQKFLQGTYFTGIKIGCVVDFKSFRAINFPVVEEFYRNTRNYPFSEQTQQNASFVFRKVFATLCEPVFDQIALMIWMTEDLTHHYRNHQQYSLPGYFNDVFLTRKIFLQEFPDKQVIIQPNVNNIVISALAEIYEAPMMLQPKYL